MPDPDERLDRLLRWAYFLTGMGIGMLIGMLMLYLEIGFA